MPNPWSMIDSSFPTFTGKESYKDQLGAMQDFLYLVVEELKYQLANLNTGNWNKTALQQFQKDTTASTDEQVAQLAEQLTKIGNRVTSMGASISELADRMKDAETELEDIPLLWEALDQLAEEVDALQEIVRPDGTGGATIGKEGQALRLAGNVTVPGGAVLGEEGKDLNLVGNVYINGILMNQQEG